MPNWCENELTITGPLAEVSALMEAVRGNGVLGDDETPFDFNKIIPYPDSFKRLDIESDAIQKKIDAMSNKDRAEYIARHGWPKDGYNQGGYQWCAKEWGTKWPACNPVVSDRKYGKHIAFRTPWGPPKPVIAALSKQFPKVKLTLRFWEGGMQFKGKEVYKGGVSLLSVKSDYYGNRGG